MMLGHGLLEGQALSLKGKSSPTSNRLLYIGPRDRITLPARRFDVLGAAVFLMGRIAAVGLF